jgi:hypothetical protein
MAQRKVCRLCSTSLSKAKRKTTPGSIRKHAIHCIPDQAAFSGYLCDLYKAPGAKNAGESKADIMWTGESHVTVAYGQELNQLAQGRSITEFLQSVTTKIGPLFYM